MRKLTPWKAYAIFLFTLAVTLAAPAQTLSNVYSFSGASGYTPSDAPLIQGTDGNLYGTTTTGGANQGGTVFKLTPSGTLTTLYNFCAVSTPHACSDGDNPNGGVIQATNGNFYGVTAGGGAGSVQAGTVFELTPSGTLTTLYNLCSESNCSDGETPSGWLVQATNGNFYGMTSGGGTHGAGVIFEITAANKYSVLYNFCSETNCVDGEVPAAGLIQGKNGDLYGTTIRGGQFNDGNVFQITTAGKLSVVYNFGSQTGVTDGQDAASGVIQATNGDLYGITNYDAEFDGGNVFQVTTAGKFTALHNFQGGTTDGKSPLGGLVQASNGLIYGTTTYGGANNDGIIFSITTAGKFAIVHSFTGTGADGQQVQGGLMQATNGLIYGASVNGGTNKLGTVYSLNVGLSPFLNLSPTSGVEGATVTIYGSGLTGATKVSFDGTSATFRAVSSTEITATVPAAAKTGVISVTTPSATIKSTASFKVTPQLTSFTPATGPVGTTVTLTGKELTQATRVTFDGVKATTLTVVSDTEITTEVPTGAKTGKIVVTTPGGTATSATSFTVTE